MATKLWLAIFALVAAASAAQDANVGRSFEDFDDEITIKTNAAGLVDLKDLTRQFVALPTDDADEAALQGAFYDRKLAAFLIANVAVACKFLDDTGDLTFQVLSRYSHPEIADNLTTQIIEFICNQTSASQYD